MEIDDTLRPCPFCGDERPTLAEVGVEPRFIVVTSPNAVLSGREQRRPTRPGRAEHLWNSRYGL